jgi:hypothetical protein
MQCPKVGSDNTVQNVSFHGYRYLMTEASRRLSREGKEIPIEAICYSYTLNKNHTANSSAWIRTRDQSVNSRPLYR